MQSRHDLSSALSNIGRYKTEFREPDDTRQISMSIPPRLLGVVIHRRFFMNRTTTNKMCLECTILDQLGDAHSTFRNYLFTSECMSAYVGRSKTNVVVCELDDDRAEGYETFGFPFSQSQPIVHQISQSDQMGYATEPSVEQLSQKEQIVFGNFPQPEPRGYSDQMGYGTSFNGLSGPL